METSVFFLFLIRNLKSKEKEVIEIISELLKTKRTWRKACVESRHLIGKFKLYELDGSMSQRPLPHTFNLCFSMFLGVLRRFIKWCGHQFWPRFRIYLVKIYRNSCIVFVFWVPLIILKYWFDYMKVFLSKVFSINYYEI